MVGVKGKYRGCNTCRLRRVKCDNERPFCKKCRDSGRECSYERETVFIIGTIEDGGRCSSHPPRVVKSSKKGKSSSRGGNDGRLELTTKGQPLPAWDDLIPLSSQGKMHQVQIAAIHTNLQGVLRGPCNSDSGGDDGNTSGSGGGKLSFLSVPIYDPPDVQPFLSQGDFELRSQCLVHLAPPEDEYSDEAMTANSICLFLYEHSHSVLASNQPPWKDPAVQNNTVRRMGPDAFRSFPNHHFFVRVYRHNAISAALLNRTPSFLADHAWIAAPWEVHPKTFFDRLLDIMVFLPSVFARADRILPQEQTVARRLMAQDLLHNCLNIERQLNDWYTAATHQPGSFWIQDPAESPLGEAQIPFADTFAFRDGVTATMFIYYWMAQVLFYPCIERLYWTIFEPVVDGPIPQAMPILPSHLQAVNPLRYATKEVHESAANICRGLDFALSNTVQPDMLAAPLYVVRQFYHHMDGAASAAHDDLIMTDGRLEIMWCEGFRSRMTAKGCDILEVVQTKQWQDLASY